MFAKIYKIFNKCLLLESFKSKQVTSMLSILFVLLSLVCFLIMLIGSVSGNVYLNKFTFNEHIKEILQRDSIKFTLLGYCINDNCSYSNNNDNKKALISNGLSKIRVGRLYYNHLDINTNEAIDKVDDVTDSAKQKADEIANEANKKVENAIKEFGLDALNALLSAFENLLPNVPTKDNSGIANPIIAAVVFNFLSLFLLVTINYNNKKLLSISIIILLLFSFLLNLGFFFIAFSIFSLLFNVIENIPSIGDNKTGSAIHLSAMSAIFLLIALILILMRLTNH